VADTAAPRWPRPQADTAAAADWPTYNRDLAGTRHSTLKQITPQNVADLRQAWAYALGRGAVGSELTPLVVAGVLYLAAGDRIVALRADTGAQLWRFVVEPAPRRSLAYWPGQDDLPARLYFTTRRALVALDAATGLPAEGFGRGGEIELPAAYDAAPTRFDNLLIVGSSSAPGGIRALDARTGTEVWAFSAVPRPGEPGAETWGDDPTTAGVHVPHEASFTIDVDRGLLFAVFGGPEPVDDYGGERRGDTLFANSIVALDARTGRRRWHFQTVHHDLWDYDLPAAPSLLDVTINGEVVPLLAVAGRTGYLYLLHRSTGVPVHGSEERPVPASDVPGESAAPTQPIPVKPAPIARVSFAASDVVTADETTPEHAQSCRELIERGGALHNAGPFTAHVLETADAPQRTTLLFPGPSGGAGWGGTAVDPSLGFVFVNTMDAGTLSSLEVDPDAPAGGTPAYRRGSAAGSRARFWASAALPAAAGNEQPGGESAWPCQKPPWGRLLAIDGASGAIAWQVPLGSTQVLPEGRRQTGRLNSGGPISTAGGLVFIGATNDRRFRAFAARTGEQLWEAELAMSAHAVPITYEAGSGKQYVAIMAAGVTELDDPTSPDAQAFVAYSLP
jgi:quinoprotein glucose dehydrogenase